MKAKNTSPQEIEASSTVHLTFGSFEPVDLPFHLIVAPIRLDGRYSQLIRWKAFPPTLAQSQQTSLGPNESGRRREWLGRSLRRTLRIQARPVSR